MPRYLKKAHPAAASQDAALADGVARLLAELRSGGEVAVRAMARRFDQWQGDIRIPAERIARARDAGLVVILDAKRGDIGTSSAHYAAAAAGMGAHWVTVSPYLGASGVEPFLDEGLGVFVLVRTSNPDSEEIQAARLESGASVSAHVASIVARVGAARVGASGVSGVGAVVGATKAVDVGAALRAAMPDQPLLIPGVGAQGGSASDVRSLVRAGASGGRAGVVVNASRSVLYAPPERGETWQGAVARSARALASELRGALG